MILHAILILGGTGLVFAVFIALANKKLWVWEDPRIEIVASMLPNANCGACGLPGCHAFAEQVVEGKVQPSKCTVSNADRVLEIAAFLGVDAGDATKRVARLMCAGGTDVAIQRAEYRGLSTCAAAAAVAGGGKGCAWGCLGLADCEHSCTFDAIRMNADRTAGGGRREVHGVRRLRRGLSQGAVRACGPSIISCWCSARTWCRETMRSRSAGWRAPPAASACWTPRRG